MRPTTWVVAADEPEMAAKIVQPMTLTCSRRPGSSPAQGERPRNSDCDSRVRNRISPMTMNSGSASSSCVVRMFQAYCARSLSRGISRNTASKTVPVTASVQPIHRPPARKANSTTNMTMTISSISAYESPGSFGDRCRAHVEVLQRQAERAWKKRATNCMTSRQTPKVTSACGIQSGVALDSEPGRTEAAPGEVDHREGEIAGESHAHRRQHRLHPAPRRGVTRASTRVTRIWPPARSVIAAPKVKAAAIR